MEYPIPVQGLLLATPNPDVFVSVAADGEAVIFTVTATPFESASEFARLDETIPWLENGNWCHIVRGTLFVFCTELPARYAAMLP